MEEITDWTLTHWLQTL